jgi:hypothetical protein
MAGVTVVERLVFTCPFCGKRAAIVDILEEGIEYPGIVHDKPECKEFEDKGVTEFLAACNQTLKGRMN